MCLFLLPQVKLMCPSEGGNRDVLASVWVSACILFNLGIVFVRHLRTYLYLISVIIQVILENYTLRILKCADLTGPHLIHTVKAACVIQNTDGIHMHLQSKWQLDDSIHNNK